MLTLYKPQLDDLWFRQAMLSDEATMSYNHAWGGTIAFPHEKWQRWYEDWVMHPKGGRYYRYLKNPDGMFVGEIAYHHDAELQQTLASIIIHARYRGKGYGGAALDLLCTTAKDNGIAVLYDDLAADNPAIRLFLRHGFTEVGRTAEKVLLRKEL